MKSINREAILKELADLRNPNIPLRDFSYKSRSWSNEDVEQGSVSMTIYSKTYSLEYILAHASNMMGEWADKFLQGSRENYVQNRMLLTAMKPDEAIEKIKAVSAINGINAPVPIPDPGTMLSSFLIIDAPHDKKVLYETEAEYIIVQFINSP